jgi:Putative NADH-flavin reductase
MKIAILGAGAGIGLASVKQALEKGHQVIALSTNISALPEHRSLTIIKGSATVPSDIKKAIENTDAVLITVGTKNKKATTLFSDIANAFVKVAGEINFTTPVITVTGFGAGESGAHLSLFMKSVITLFLKQQYLNKTTQEQILTSSTLNWEIVRPGRLTNGALTGHYRVLPQLSNGMNVTKISREDVAKFLVEEAEQKQFLKRYVALTY